MHAPVVNKEGNAQSVRGPGYSVQFWKWYDEYAVPRLKSWADRPGCGLFETRASTFRKMFEYLDRFDRRVVIIETGCAHDLDNWGGNGCSTLLFDKYAQLHPGSMVFSVDTDQAAVDLCKSAVCCTEMACGDSVEALRNFAKNWGLAPDLVYLDASDLKWDAPLLAQKHHLDELLAILPAIHPETLVAVDDSPVVIEDLPYIEIGGKGALVARAAAELGAKELFSEYQIGWTGIKEPVETKPSDPVDLKKMLQTAGESFDEGRVMDANKLFRQVYILTSTPLTRNHNIARGIACVFFAQVAAANKRLGTALDWYNEAILRDPEMAGYRLELVSRVLRPMRHWDRAKAEATVATRIEPDNRHAWSILGGVLLQMEDLEGAKNAFKRAMEIDPSSAGPKLDLMSALFEQPDYETCKKLADEILATDVTGPPRGDALQALAFIAYRESKHEESIKLFDQALEEGVGEPPTCHWNKSLALHALGRYREGWEEHTWRAVERTQLPLYMPVNRFQLPMWKGEEPPIRLHVHAEAGFGDNLCCSRYLQILVGRGYEVTYETYSNMLALMARSFSQVKVIPQALDYPGAIGVPPFDYHVPIGELPHVLGTEVNTVPWYGPYLMPNPEMVEQYSKVVSKAPWDIKVGLCWSAGIRDGLWIAKYGRRKSMRFRDLLNLCWTTRGYTLFNLQVGPERAECQDFVKTYIWDVLPNSPSWDDTAALIANLDLVITVDSAVAHLAGAMGKPVWLMNSAEPGSWHWMAERPGSPWNEKSPWYPSVKIYRQQAVGEWNEVVERVSRDLEEFTHGFNTQRLVISCG